MINYFFNKYSTYKSAQTKCFRQNFFLYDNYVTVILKTKMYWHVWYYQIVYCNAIFFCHSVNCFGSLQAKIPYEILDFIVMLDVQNNQSHNHLFQFDYLKVKRQFEIKGQTPIKGNLIVYRIFTNFTKVKPTI